MTKQMSKTSAAAIVRFLNRHNLLDHANYAKYSVGATFVLQFASYTPFTFWVLRDAERALDEMNETLALLHDPRERLAQRIASATRENWDAYGNDGETYIDRTNCWEQTCECYEDEARETYSAAEYLLITTRSEQVLGSRWFLSDDERAELDAMGY